MVMGMTANLAHGWLVSGRLGGCLHLKPPFLWGTRRASSCAVRRAALTSICEQVPRWGHRREVKHAPGEATSAMDVVERACHLCVSVRASMDEGEGQLDKIDNTPVTIADFGVQALVSLELGRLFPSIPLVGEEDSSQLRIDYENIKASGNSNKSLVESIVDVLSPVSFPGLSKLDCETVLTAIDRGATSLAPLDGGQAGQSSYWVLDPIDGTRGFLRGGDALYVVGLALIEDGKPILGVMGCPNIAFQTDGVVVQMGSTYHHGENHRTDKACHRGLIMAAALGGGCWVKSLQQLTDSGDVLLKCQVDRPDSAANAWFCISDHERWSTLPLAQALAAGLTNRDRVEQEDGQVLPLCCGSLCKYFTVSLGGASAFLLHADRTTPLKVWDHAAGVVCLVEAGGQVSELEGTPLENLIGNRKETFTVQGGGIIASNGSLHSLLLRRLQEHSVSLGH